MAKKQRLFKNTFMGPDKGPSLLPETCKTCFGFSNWAGDREHVPYADRDCSECENKPEV